MTIDDLKYRNKRFENLKIKDLKISELEIEVFSFLHGSYRFNGEDWSQYSTFTKYPPTDGTAKISRNGSPLFAGDWMYFLKTQGMTPDDFKTW